MYCVSNIAGGGKTYAAIEYAADRAAMDFKIMIALPSKQAIDQCYDDLTARFPSVMCAKFHSDTQQKKPVPAILEKMKDLRKNHRNRGFVMFVTHAAMNLIHKNAREGWHVIVDEVPGASGAFTHNAITRGIRQAVKIIPQGPKYCLIKPKRKGFWKGIALGKKAMWWNNPATGTMVGGTYQVLAAELIKDDVDVWGITEQWDDKAILNPTREVNFFTELKPNMFDGFEGSPIIMSAQIEHTMLYHMWHVNHGVEWKIHKPITRNVRYSKHTNGDLLTINYLIERDFSKKIRDTEAVAGSGLGSVLNQSAIITLKAFGSEPFAYMCNNDVDGELDEIFGEQGTRLPNTPHGLNSFMHLHQAAIFSALNLTPAHTAFLKFRGLSSDETRQAITYQATYQAALRISIRDPENTDKKLLVVQDKGCADYIASLFPGSSVAHIPMGLTGFRTPQSKGRGRDVLDSERKKAYRDEQKLKLGVGVYLLELPNGNLPLNVPRTIVIKACGTLSGRSLGMSLFDSTANKTPCHVIQWTNTEDFVACLRDLHADVLAQKSDGKLISPSIFDPELARIADDRNEKGELKIRGRSAVVSSVGIWLDNDGGVLPKEEFAALFPDLEMVIYNTYSSTPDKEKYRVWIPTTHGMSPDLYMHITGQIRAKVEAHGTGYRSPQFLLRWIVKYMAENGGQEPTDLPWLNHGFDWSKTYPENLMYLPCQAGAGSDASFFMHLTGGLRAPLDVVGWVEHPITNIRPEPDPEPVVLELEPPVEWVAPKGVSAAVIAMAKLLHDQSQAAYQAQLQQIQQQKVTNALNKWYLSNVDGCRNDGFWILAVDLKHAGLDYPDIQAHLRTVSAPAAQKAQIPNIMKNIKRGK